MVEVGLLRPNASGAGWELTTQACELLRATLARPYKSNLAAELLDLGVIEPAPPGLGLWWAFTSRGREVIRHLLTNPLPTEERHPDSDPGGALTDQMGGSNPRTNE